MTLSEFLLTRIAEDETVARRSQGGMWSTGGLRMVPQPEVDDSAGWAPAAPGWVLVEPRHILAECEAKRRIVGIYDYVSMSEPDEGYPSVPLGGDGPETYYEAVQHLALVYADHPDYDDAWRP